MHLFLTRPEAVKWYVPWAQPPFYANVDEQTLMNDCVRSSIANVTCYAQAGSLLCDLRQSANKTRPCSLPAIPPQKPLRRRLPAGR